MSSVDSLRRELTVRGRSISDNDPTYIIGEIACGHQGDVDQCKKLIEAVADSGADAVQLEFFYPPANAVGSLDFYKIIESLSFTREQWADLMTHARCYDIAVSAFVYDDVSMEWALALKPDMLKINSSDISNPDIIVAAAQSGLPFTLGTGASTMQEVEEAINLTLRHGGDRLVLQHGVQNFPTDANNAHIRRISLLKDKFDCLVMYADHTDAKLDIAQALDLTAIGMGACMIEKHIVLDRAQEGVDWQAALEPGEFKSYVNTMQAGWSALGPNFIQAPTDSDEKYRRFQKKSIVAASDIHAGAIITREHVAFLRAQGKDSGLSPMQFSRIEGRSIRRFIPKWQQITLEDMG